MEAFMTEYRAYAVGPDGHFRGFEPLICADDHEAIEKAKRLVGIYAIELWSGSRFVKRLSAAEKASGEAITHEPDDGKMIPRGKK